MKSFQFKRTQCKYRTRYKIGNWATDEGGLRRRGSVTIWISEDVRKAWCYRGRRKPGGRQIYSNVAIETFWTIGMLYALPLRQTERFIESLYQLAGFSLPVPDHTVVSRRVRKLGKVPMLPSKGKGPIHLLVGFCQVKSESGTLGPCRTPERPMRDTVIR